MNRRPPCLLLVLGLLTAASVVEADVRQRPGRDGDHRAFEHGGREGGHRRDDRRSEERSRRDRRRDDYGAHERRSSGGVIMRQDERPRRRDGDDHRHPDAPRGDGRDSYRAYPPDAPWGDHRWRDTRPYPRD